MVVRLEDPQRAEKLGYHYDCEYTAYEIQGGSL